MSTKGKRIAAVAEKYRTSHLDPHYTGYFELFNDQKYYEAHDVLEHIWLKDKHGSNGAFYKGLIQLAGAFVHLQKNRMKPAASLFKLAQANLEKYPAQHDHFDNREAVHLIINWITALELTQYAKNPLGVDKPPKLILNVPKL